MIDVKLFAATDKNPIDMASLAAGICYQDKIPEMGKRLNVREKLFDVSHHTTIQHHSTSFLIEGIAVGDITFGMHLTNPFYNSDQRSGRYCAKMFPIEKHQHSLNQRRGCISPKVSDCL